MKRKIGNGVIRFIAVLLAVLLSVGTMLPAAPTVRATEGAAYGAVTVLTGAEDCTVSGSESGNTTVSNQTPVELKWSAADASVGRYQDGWWIGIKVMAPEGMSDAELETVQYKRGNGSIGSFWSSKDSLSAPHYITLWGLINEEYLYNALNAGKHLTYQWEFDWAKSDFAEGETQIVKIDIDPENISLMSEDGTQQVYPLAGEVSVLTGPANCTVTGSKRANTTISNPEPVELKWSAADASVGRYQDGWWIGIKVMAPEGMSDAELETVQYKRGNGSIGEFWKSKDSANAPHYITLWGLINEEYLYNALNSGTHLTYQWEFDWAKSDFATGKTQIVKLDIDPQNIILKSEDGTKQVYPIFGDVSVLTGAETCVVTGNKTSSTTVETPEKIELQWYPADAAAGRNQDGWWIGIKVTAPEGMSDAELTTVKYQRGNGSIGEFWQSKDSSNAPHYITLWGLVNEEYLATALNGGTHLSYQWKFDWTGSDFAEDMTQVVTIDIDPQNIVLKKSDDASYQYPSDPLYGTLDSLTDGMAVDNSDLTHPTASSIDGGKVELLWAPKDTSIGRYQDGWWVGVKINAPEGMEYDFAAEDNNPVYYQRRVNGGEWSDRKNFNVLKDSSTAPHYLTFWMPLTEESWEANQELSYDLRFDWNRDGIYEQTMTVSCKARDFVLVNENGSKVEPYRIGFSFINGELYVCGEDYPASEAGIVVVDYQGGLLTYSIEANANFHIETVKEGDNIVFPVTDDDEIAVENQTQKVFEHSFTPTGDITVMAEILIDTNDLTVSVTDSEQGKAAGNTVSPLQQTIDYNDTGTIAIHCAKGYIAEVQTADGTVLMTVSGKDNAVDETYTTGAITEDTELQVVFTPVEYEITYHTPVGTTPDTETYTVEDDAVSLQQLTETGFVFVGWMEKSEDDKVDGTTGSAITAMDPSECRDIDLYAVWTVDTEITAKQGDNEVISGSVTNGAEVTLTITSALEDAVYSYTCANVLGKTVDSTKGTIERTEANANVMDTFDVDYAAFDKDDVAYIYAATSTQEHGFVLWQDACKPTVVINDIWKQLWLLAQEGIRPILAYNSEKSYTLTITDNQDYDSGVAARCYAFVPYNAAVELTEDAVVEQVMEKYNLQWIEITEATTEIKNPEKNPTEGECVLILRAIDQVGNVAYADTEGMLFDNTPPKITATYNATQVKDSEEYYSNGNSVTALIRIEDEFLATSDNDESFTYSVFVNGKENIQLENPTLNRNDESIVFTGEVTFPCKPDEENQEDQEAQEEEFALTVTAMDAAGNAAEAYKATVVVDQKAPTIDVAYAYIWGGEPASASDSSDSSEDAKAKVYSNGDITATVTIRDTYLDFAQDEVNPTVELNGTAIEADEVTLKDGGTEWVATFTISKEDYLGVNVLSVNVSDECGNEASYTSGSLLIDTQKPTIDVAYAYTWGGEPASANDSSDSSEGEKAKVYSNGDITATVTIRDAYLDFAQDGVTPTIKLNGEEIDIDANQITWVDGGTEWVATFTISNEGVNVLSVNVSDECGNEASYTSGSLLIDTQKPTIDVSYTYTNGENTLSASDSSEGEKAKVYSNGDITVKITIQDSYLDFANDGVVPTIKLNDTQLSSDDYTSLEWENGGTEWVATFTISKEDYLGVNELSVNVSDESGNEASYTSGSLLIDTEKPTITVSYDYANGHYESGSYHADEDDTSIGHFANGDIAVTVTIQDAYLDFAQDGVTPTIKLKGEEDEEIDIEADEVTWKDGGTRWTATFVVPSAENSYAKYELIVSASDECGNQNLHSKDLRLDTKAPEIESVTIGKTQSALDKVLNFLTFGIFFNGEIEVKVTVRDDSIHDGKSQYPEGQVSQVSLLLDSNAVEGVEPTTTEIVTDSEGKQFGAVTFELPSTYLTKDVAAQVSFTLTDAAGNTSENVKPDKFINADNPDESSASNTFLYETTAPFVDFSAIQDNAVSYYDTETDKYWVRQNVAEIRFDVLDQAVNEANQASGIAKVEITLNGEAVDVTNGDKTQNTEFAYENQTHKETYSILCEKLKAGKNTVAVTATDNAGNSTTKAYTFAVYKDITAPTADFSAIEANTVTHYGAVEDKYWVLKDTTIFFSVSDATLDSDNSASGLAEVKITLNGKAVNVSDGEKTQNIAFTYTSRTLTQTFSIAYDELSEGKNEVAVTATDNVGNQKTYTYVVYKDITAPTTDFSAIEANTVTHHDAVEDKYWVLKDTAISFSVSDVTTDSDSTASGIAKVEIKLNGKAVNVSDGEKTQNSAFTYASRTLDKSFSIVYKDLNEGRNEIAVTVTDNAGNQKTYTYVVYKDITAPTTDFSAIEANTVTHHDAVEDKYWVLKDTAISFSVSDATTDSDNTASGIAKVEITLNGKAVNVANGEKTQNSAFVYTSRTLTETFSIAYDELSEGKNEIAVTATDNVGNQATYTFVVYKDTTTLTTDFRAIEANTVTYHDTVEDKYWVLKDTAISFSVSDATSDSDNTASGIAKVEITLNGEAVRVSNGNKTLNGVFTYASRTLVETFSIAYDDLNEGRNEVTVTATDNTGNQETYSYVVYKDPVAPQITSISFNPAPKYDEGDESSFTNPTQMQYGFYFNSDTVVTISASDDASGMNGITYYTVNSFGEASESKTSSVDDNHSISFIVEAGFKGQIYACPTDNVGNMPLNADNEPNFTTPDGTVLETQEQHKLNAFITIERKDPVNEKDHAGYPLYADNVPMTITVSDTFAGLREVEWSVKLDETTIESGKVFVDNYGKITSNGGSAAWTGTKNEGDNIVPVLVGKLTVSKEGTGITVYVKLTDRAGNISEFTDTISIDKTVPTCTVTYNNDVQTKNGNSYYDEPVTATIKIDELNFDPNDFQVKVNGAAATISGWQQNGTVWTTTATMSHDGEYVFEVTGADMAKNPLTPYQSNTKIVDQTAPTCVVTYSQEAQTANGNSYHSAPVTATIRITEQNFDADDFQVKVNGAAAAISGWQQNGTVWTTTVTMSRDGEYIFEVTGEDMAKNVMDPYKSNKKIVDQTAPVCDVTFNQEVQTLNENAYHDGPVTATIRITEQNFNPNDFRVTVNGAAAQITGWAQNGTVWTTSVTMSEDGEYVFEVTGADMARNALTPYKSNTRIVDATKPAIVLDGIKNESANNADTIGFTLTVTDVNILDSDIAPKLTVVNWTGKGIEPASFPEETIQLEKTSATADGQTIYTYTVKNLEKDGFYTLVCTAKDLSGNTFSTILVTDDAKEADTVYFSVNRDGSVFWLETEHTDKYADGKVLHNELFGAYANDTVKVILHEVNVDEVNLKDATKPSKFTVSNGSLTTEVELVEGENYEKNSRIGAGGWYENTYTLNNDLFAEDGSYSVNLLTYDRAGNSNTNTKEEDGRMQFVVDRTDPVISSNAKTDQRINASDYMLEFNITETNLAEETLAVKINGEPVSTENLIAVGGNTYQYQLTDGLNQTVEIYAKDKAGNESGVYRIDSLTISTNVIVLWYANTPLFWGSIGGVAALTALIAWLIIAKKRKQEKQEA